MRSTIHLFGKKGLGPFSGISLSKSMAIPSLLNSLTHTLITSSGAIFGGCRTISAVHPKTLRTQLAQQRMEEAAMSEEAVEILGDAPELVTYPALRIVGVWQDGADGGDEDRGGFVVDER